MRIIDFLDNNHIALAEPIAIYSRNLSVPLFIGLVGNVTLSFLKNEIKSIEFECGEDKYKNENLFFTFKIMVD